MPADNPLCSCPPSRRGRSCTDRGSLVLVLALERRGPGPGAPLERGGTPGPLGTASATPRPCSPSRARGRRPSVSAKPWWMDGGGRCAAVTLWGAAGLLRRSWGAGWGWGGRAAAGLLGRSGAQALGHRWRRWSWRCELLAVACGRWRCGRDIGMACISGSCVGPPSFFLLHYGAWHARPCTCLTSSERYTKPEARIWAAGSFAGSAGGQVVG